MGRHSSGAAYRRRIAGKIFLVGSLVVAGATAAQALAAGIGFAGASRVAPTSEAPQACGAVNPLAVSVAPEVESVVRAVLDRVTAAEPCQQFAVTANSGQAIGERIIAGKAPEVWIPDSFTWLDVVNTSGGTATWKAGPSLAKTPVVIASPVRGTGVLTTAPASWSELINVKGEPRMANPDQDTASRLAYLTSRLDQKRVITRDTASRLIFTSRFAKDSVKVLFDIASGDPENTRPFPAPEQLLAQFVKEHPGVLTSTLPKSGTMSMDYPFVVNPTLDQKRAPLVDAARAALTSAEAKSDFAAAGFRDASNAGGPTIEGKAPKAYTEVPVVDAEARLAAIGQWDVLRTDMRMLAIVDVSGSMRYPAKGTNGLTRAKVTEEALIVALKVLPGESKIGGWVFSTNQSPGKDWKETASIRRLASPEGKATWREHLMDVVRTIPNELRGDTGLYDTTWAAFQKMQQEYDPKLVNSVVIFTDGENDDPGGGLSLKELVSKMDAAWDIDRPVRIVTIGMGEADPSALKAISKATGGTSYIANTPDDIQRVFVEALLARINAPKGQ